jgi:murein DD-endopeptidase MepM/ murein hydrolase activator NlpD
MRFTRRFRNGRDGLTLACLIAFGLAAGRGQSAGITLTPAVVESGSPVLIRVQAAGAKGVDGEWLGRKLDFFRGRGGQGWFALAGADVEAPEGPSTLEIAVHTKRGAHELSRTVEILPAQYRTDSLTVEPEYVEPGPEAMRQIETEEQLKEKVFGASAPKPLWTGNFRRPVAAPMGEGFGTRRVFNGKLASIHKGLDFRARTGTPVRAGNSGVVALARPLYYEGNCVVIDHGLGLFTISMHLSRIDVKEGQRVTRGGRLGLSGDTGRVTGPHLHWGVRWQGAYLDPGKLLRMKLGGVR